MTRERAKELLPFIEAYAQGKPIQFRVADGPWETAYDLGFSTELAEYRIKPEPREWWIRFCGGTIPGHESVLLSSDEVSKFKLRSPCEHDEFIHVREVLR